MKLGLITASLLAVLALPVQAKLVVQDGMVIDTVAKKHELKMREEQKKQCSKNKVSSIIKRMSCKRDIAEGYAKKGLIHQGRYIDFHFLNKSDAEIKEAIKAREAVLPSARSSYGTKRNLGELRKDKIQYEIDRLEWLLRMDKRRNCIVSLEDAQAKIGTGKKPKCVK